MAADEGHDAVVRALLIAGADKDFADISGYTPLCIAAGNGHVSIVRALLDAGADKRIATNTGQTPMSLAAEGAFGIESTSRHAGVFLALLDAQQSAAIV